MSGTCEVIGTLADVGLAPVAGAELRFEPANGGITRDDNTVVIPAPQSVTTDATGAFSVDLVAGRYRVSIMDSQSGVSKAVLITVPSAAIAYMAQLLNLPAPATLDAAQQAVLDAQTARDAANVSAASAASSATAAVTAKTQAETARDVATSAASAAQTSATAAADSASQAAGSAGAAAASAGNASGSAAAAATSAAAAATSKTGADTAAAAAATSKTGADTSAAAAATSATAAGTARTGAETARDAAQLSASNAGASATAAGNSATAAAGSAAAAAASASSAAGAASSASTSATTASGAAAGAVTARTGAETARTGAEAARDAAAGSATAAAGSATAALGSANTAEAARIAAQAARDTAIIAQGGAQSAQVASQTAAAASNVSAAAAADTAARALSIYGSAEASQAAVQAAQAAASVAQGHAASAASIVQQDLSGINAAALHRSPNATTALCIYDTSKDSDGGAWTERCQHTSWWNETLAGQWLGANDSDFQARNFNATVSPTELVVNGDFASATGWMLQAGWTVSGGQLVINNSVAYNNSVSSMFQTPLSAGKTYRITYTISGYVSGGVRAALVNTVQQSLTTRSANGTYTEYAVAGPNSLNFVGFQATGAGTTLNIDNVSVREVTALTTASGDYYQLSTDGKFYRLWKNLANGSADVGSSTFWLSPQTVNGITATKVASGFDTDGLPYADYSVVGTASADSFIPPYATGLSRMASATGQQFTGSFLSRVISGTPPPAGSGIRVEIVGETAPSTTVEVSTGALFNGTTETAVSLSYTLANAASNQARVRIQTVTLSGVTVNYTIRVKGLQFELGSTRTTYEANTGINEVFRGNKRDFPRLAAIVAETGNVTIYDLTEPGRPMWMRFTSGSSGSTANFIPSASAPLTGIVGVNGQVLVSAQGSGVIDFNFALDRGRQYLTVGASEFSPPVISARNSLPVRTLGVTSTPAIASTTVNAIAATVMPNAPIDPVTGLRVPTVAVATAGGISVIQHNWLGFNSASTISFDTVVLTPSLLSAGRTADANWYYAQNPASLGASFTLLTRSGAQSPGFNLFGTSKQLDTGRARLMRRSGGQRLVQMARVHESDPSRSLVATVGDTFNTGWMAGDIRRAYLADNAVGSVSGPELVTNGDFSSGLTGWSDASTAPSTVSVVGGVATFNISGANNARLIQTVSTVVGRTYQMRCGGGNGTALAIGTTQGGFDILAFAGVSARTTALFVATTTTTWINTTSSSNTSTLDDVSIREVIPDRSYRAASASITGSLTRAQLASGTSLVGYAGWSTLNYLQEPYSADLDFGTGEWTASAWVNLSDTPRRNLALGSALIADPVYWGVSNVTAGITTTKVGSGIDTDGLPYVDWRIAGTATATSGTSIYSIQNSRIAATAGQQFTSSFLLRLIAGTAPSAGNGGIRSGMIGETVAFAATDFFGSIISTPAVETMVSVTGTLANGSTVYTRAAPEVVIINGATYDYTVRIKAFQFERGAVRTAYQAVTDTNQIWAGVIAERSHSTGPSVSFRAINFGQIQAVVNDGTTTRTVTTAGTYPLNQWMKLRVSYTTDGSLTLLVNGREAAVTRGAPLLTLNNASGVLTIGNSFATDSPFPGALALVKLGASVPTPEQATFMFEQERHLFRAGALSVLPDSGAVVDMSYDEATDRWVAVSATNESYWTGLVRNSNTLAPAGSFSRVVAGAGVELAARSSVTPGVDVTIPAYGLREELVRRAESAARLSREVATYDFVGGFTASTTSGSTTITSVAGLTYPASIIGARVSGAGIPANATIVAVSGTTIYLSAAATATASGVSVSFLDFRLPVGLQALTVFSAGVAQREGATQAFTRLFDGFVETVRFAVAPGVTALVTIQATRGAVQ